MRLFPLQPAWVLALLVCVPGVRALDVFNYSAATNERFSSGFPSAPVANSSFFLNSFNLSGIGWTSGNFGVTMISPQHFLTVAHVSAGSSISFLNTAGAVKSYAVDSTFTFPHGTGQATDLMIGRLSAPIPTSDNVTHYPTLLLNSVTDYQGLTVASFGSGQRAGTNTIDLAGNADILPFGGGNGIADNFVFITDFDAVTGQTQGQGGDSGSPSFVNVNGTLALVGVHSAVDTESSPVRMFDVLVPGYYNQINTRLGMDGYSFGAFTAIPEPETTATIFGAMALLGVTVFRIRSRRMTKCTR